MDIVENLVLAACQAVMGTLREKPALSRTAEDWDAWRAAQLIVIDSAACSSTLRAAAGIKSIVTDGMTDAEVKRALLRRIDQQYNEHLRLLRLMRSSAPGSKELS